MESASPVSRTLDGAILVAGLSALSYALSFAYGMGYSSFFGVPTMLVEVTPKNLLLCATAVVVGSPLFQFVDGLLRLWPQSWPQAVRRAVLRFLLWPVLALAAAFVLGGDRVLLWFLVPMAFSALYQFVDPLTHTEKATYREKLEAAQAARLKQQLQQPPGIPERLAGRFGHTAVDVLFVCYLGVAVAWGVGYHEARTRVDFLVPTTGQPCVVVAPYSEELICSAFDSASHKLMGNLRLIPLHDPRRRCCYST